MIDVSLKEQGLPTDAYYAVEEVHDVSIVHIRGTLTCEGVLVGWYTNL